MILYESGVFSGLKLLIDVMSSLNVGVYDFEVILNF